MSDEEKKKEDNPEQEPLEGEKPENEEAPENQEKKKKSSKLEVYDWLQCVVTALVAGILIFIFIARVVRVEGGSMKATLQNSDLVLASNLFYTPQNGDIIVLQTDSYGPSALVKRVIATEGQTVSIDFDAGIVYVDGEALDEPYTNTPTNLPQDFVGPVTVPEGCIFVMGDNRNSSLDSRNSDVGMVDTRCVVGKVYLVLVPGIEYDENNVPIGRDFSRMGSPY